MTDKLHIKYIPVAELITKLHPRNPKNHNLGLIIGSFQEHGFVSPGTLDSRTDLFLCGHGRTEALQMMIKQKMDAPRGIIVNGGGWECPAVCGYHSKNDEQALAYLVMDNKATIDGDWNEIQLSEILQELANSDEIGIESSGYDLEDLDQLLADLAADIIPVEDPGAQIDKAAELNKKWHVKRGQIWEIPSSSGDGVHRIMCGDSTSADDVGLLMCGVKADAVVTDPPYNVAQDTGLYAQNQSKSLKQLAESEWDRNFDPILFLENTYEIMKPDCWLYIFTAHHLFGGIFDWLNERYAKTSFCVWCKPNPMPSLAKNTWTFGVELCLFSKNGKPIFNYPDGSHALNWWPFNKKSDGSHPTQKTLDVISHIVNHVTSPGYIICDWFLGSGTTLVACEQTGRVGYGMEISPDYVAVCLERLGGMGLQPKRATK